MRFGIIANVKKDPDMIVTNKLKDCILDKGGEIEFVSNLMSMVKQQTSLESVEKADVVFCLGGDGSFLKVARLIYSTNIPLVGINMGSLGFLTEVEIENISDSVEKIMNGNYSIEDRMMIETKIIRNNEVIAKDVAINDVVISRGALSRILHIKTYINDVFLDAFPGDGLIVSTPTGSTGYSLSAGGPMVDPDVEMIILSPICPHILYSRSFVATGDKVVKCEVDEDYKHGAMVTVDGQIGHEIKGGDVIEVKKLNQCVKMLRINPMDFYHVLRTKLHYRGERIKNYEVQ